MSTSRGHMKLRSSREQGPSPDDADVLLAGVGNAALSAMFAEDMATANNAAPNRSMGAQTTEASLSMAQRRAMLLQTGATVGGSGSANTSSFLSSSAPSATLCPGGSSAIGGSGAGTMASILRNIDLSTASSATATARAAAAREVLSRKMGAIAATFSAKENGGGEERGGGMQLRRILPPLSAPPALTTEAASAVGYRLGVVGTHLAHPRKPTSATSSSFSFPSAAADGGGGGGGGSVGATATQGTALNRSAFASKKLAALLPPPAAAGKAMAKRKNNTSASAGGGEEEEDQAELPNDTEEEGHFGLPLSPIGDVSRVLRAIAGTMDLITTDADRARLRRLRERVEARAAGASVAGAPTTTNIAQQNNVSMGADDVDGGEGGEERAMPLGRIAQLPPSQLFADWCASFEAKTAATTKGEGRRGQLNPHPSSETTTLLNPSSSLASPPMLVASKPPLETAMASRNAAVSLHKEVRRQLSILFAAAAAAEAEDEGNTNGAKKKDNASDSQQQQQQRQQQQLVAIPESPRAAAIAAAKKLSHADRARRIRRVYDDATYEIVRQVSLHCAERARLLAFVWVSSSDALASLAGSLEAQAAGHAKEVKSLQLANARLSNSYETLSTFVCDSAKAEGEARVALMDKFFAAEKAAARAATEHKNEVLTAKAAVSELLTENKQLKELLRRRRDFLRADGGFVFLRSPSGSRVVRRRKREAKYKGIYYDDPDVVERREFINSISHLDFSRLRLPYDKYGRSLETEKEKKQKQKEKEREAKRRAKRAAKKERKRKENAEAAAAESGADGKEGKERAGDKKKRKKHQRKASKEKQRQRSDGSAGASSPFAEALHIDSSNPDGSAEQSRKEEEQQPSRLRRRLLEERHNSNTASLLQQQKSSEGEGRESQLQQKKRGRGSTCTVAGGGHRRSSSSSPPSHHLAEADAKEKANTVATTRRSTKASVSSSSPPPSVAAPPLTSLGQILESAFGGVSEKTEKVDDQDEGGASKREARKEKKRGRRRRAPSLASAASRNSSSSSASSSSPTSSSSYDSDTSESSASDTSSNTGFDDSLLNATVGSSTYYSEPTRKRGNADNNGAAEGSRRGDDEAGGKKSDRGEEEVGDGAAAAADGDGRPRSRDNEKRIKEKRERAARRAGNGNGGGDIFFCAEPVDVNTDGENSSQWSGDLRSVASHDSDCSLFTRSGRRVGRKNRLAALNSKGKGGRGGSDSDDSLIDYEELAAADEAEEIIQSQLKEIFKLRLQVADLTREVDKLRDTEREVVFRHTAVNTTIVETREVGVTAAPGMGIGGGGARRRR